MSKKYLHNQAAIPLAPQTFGKSPTIITHGSKKRQEHADLVMLRYKDMDVPVEVQAGSTVPLMEMASGYTIADEDYNPFEHRSLDHPTSDLDTLVHLLKGSLGSGIMAMPLAFRNAGLWVGLVCTFIIGAICTYCVHTLVKTAHVLCRRMQVPILGFAETAEAAFLAGPPSVHKFSRLSKALVNMFLVIDLLGCCCVYISFVANNLKQVVDFYTIEDKENDEGLDIRLYMVMLLPILFLIILVRNLKFLAPFSMVANVLIGTGMGITFYYLFTDVPSLDSVPAFAGWSHLPTFFGTAIFALEGIGVVMPLENNMKHPSHFIGCPGVLNSGMLFVISLYAVTGFFGFLKFGANTKDSITYNLDESLVPAQCVKIMIAIAMFLTYSLQFYVPMEIIWKNLKHHFGSKKNLGEYGLRTLIMLGTMCVAIAVPNIGPFISLVGAVCLSTLGLMFPAILETVCFWDIPGGFGKFNWILWKNVLLVVFGLVGFASGTYVSLNEIMKTE